MRHKVAGRKLGRTAAHRRALLRNLSTALFEYERIITTLPKAKELKRVADKLVTVGKAGSLAARRRLLGYLTKPEIAHKIMDEVAPRFVGRHGGYTRVFKLGNRGGDQAERALISLVGSDYKPKDTAKKKDKKK